MRLTGSSNSGRSNAAAARINERLTMALYTPVLRSIYSPSALISMPSFKYASMVSPTDSSGKSTCASAMAATITQRWFGVWKPPAIIPGTAVRTTSPKASAICAAPSSSAACWRAAKTTGAIACRQKPASGAESKLVLSRSKQPEGWRCRRTNSVASKIRCNNSALR